MTNEPALGIVKSIAGTLNIEEDFRMAQYSVMKRHLTAENLLCKKCKTKPNLIYDICGTEGRR